MKISELIVGLNINKVLKPSEIGVPIIKYIGEQKKIVLPDLLTRLLVYSLQTLPR
jgi:hypothetical protein